MEEIETVTIPKTEYAFLQDRAKWLSALEAAGVDNWQGCEQAAELMEESD